MNLKGYNKENSLGNIKLTPTLNVSLKGEITLNTAASKLMDVSPGDGIELFQDLDKPKDWYVAKTEKGFVTTASHNGGGVRMRCLDVCRKIVESLDYPYPSGTMQIGEVVEEDGVSYYTIITSSIKFRGKKS